jgi:hypothetical protein
MAAESEFVAVALEVGNRILPHPQYQVEQSAVLLYQITVDNKLEISVDVRSPVRGSSAFETDLCVFEKRDVKDKAGVVTTIHLPRVVMEFKTGITTHDVLTYSAKAKKHKQVYPYLRYGMVSSQLSKVPGLYFTHNESLDFCASVSDLHEPDLSAFFEGLLTDEISCSKMLEEIAFGDKKLKSRLFRNVPVFDCNKPALL